MSPETLACTATGTSLTRNDRSGIAGDSFIGAVDPSLPLNIRARLKITSSPSTFFYLEGTTTTHRFAVGLSTAALTVYTATGDVQVALGGKGFHDAATSSTRPRPKPAACRCWCWVWLPWDGDGGAPPQSDPARCRSSCGASAARHWPISAAPVSDRTMVRPARTD